MDEINEIQKQFTSSASSIQDISKKVKLLINAVNTLETDMEAQNIVSSSGHSKYGRSYLKTLSKSELIDLIIQIQSKAHNPTNSSNVWSDPHENTAPKQMKATERMATDYDKIEKQRARIKALKEKDTKTLRDRNACHSETQKVFTNPHEKQIKRMRPTERMATDYDKIEKSRAAIRALKEKKKQEKLQYENQLKQRNAHRSNNLWANPHEKVVVSKLPLKSQKKVSKKKRDDTSNKDKIVDPVSKSLMEQRQNVKEELNTLQGIDENVAAIPDKTDEVLEGELLKLNMKVLKKKCKSYKLSYEGSKLDMIARILAKEQKKQTKMMDQESREQDDFMRQMESLSSSN
eukprot:79487_1